MADRAGQREFVSVEQLGEWVDRLGELGPRHTGSRAHDDAINWVENELRDIVGITVRSEPFSVLGWVAEPDGDLELAGALQLLAASSGDTEIPVGGAVPYSRPTGPGGHEGEFIYLGATVKITAENAAGKIILRDFPSAPLPYAALGQSALFVTEDVPQGPADVYDRPAFADDLLHADLLAAGAAGATGVVFAFDLPREQVKGYFEPHKGTHYDVPAIFVGVDEREVLRTQAETGRRLRVHVKAHVEEATTRNVIGTLPGQSAERIVVLSHSDGHTWVQENGGAVLVGLARYFASVPLADRKRTIEFVVTSGHLHISREGTADYAQRLDAEYDQGDLALVIAIEHMGTLELVPVPRKDRPGRELAFTGEQEVMLWAAGPSASLQEAVIAAVTGRELDKVVVGSGLGTPDPTRVPAIASFGGIGTYFHQHLVPTTALISGPWSLWAPSFGRTAVDRARLHSQSLALADLIHTVDEISREDLAGHYLADRKARTEGASTWLSPQPPECASQTPKTEPTPEAHTS